MNKIKIITVVFDILLSNKEIEYLRGAVIHKLSGKVNDILAHNHIDRNGKLRYQYPLVQYKILNGHAAIVCLEEGTHVISELISGCDFSFMLGKRSVQMHVREFLPTLFEPRLSTDGFVYSVKRWQALNSNNYQTYKELVSLSDKISFLENILTGHVLALYRGLGIYVDIRVECSITKLSQPYTTTYKDITTTLFDLSFICNISLPVNCGLGKGGSIGYGIIQEIK